MKIIKCLFMLILFVLFLPSVDALSYDIGTNLSKIDDSRYEIRLSFKDISNTDYGIGACTFNVYMSDTVGLNGEMRTVGSWNIDGSDLLIVESGKPALSNTEFLVIPIKITDTGKLTISNISCSDDMDEIKINDKIIDVVYKVNNSTNNSNNNSNNNNNSNGNNNSNNNNSENDSSNDKNDNQVVLKDSNCDLSDIILSDGKIDFESSIVEYNVEVSDIEKLEVTPILSSDKAEFVIDREDNKIVIKVTAEDDTVKNYTIYLEEVEIVEKKEKNKYIPIFIGITCLLVLINIIRVSRKFIPNKG